MQQLKDKRVKAISTGDTRGAARVDAAMKRLRDRIIRAISARRHVAARHGRRRNAAATRPAGPRGQPRRPVRRPGRHRTQWPGCRTEDRQRDASRRPHPRATRAAADPGATRRTHHTGRVRVMRGPLHRSNGGPVWGEGTATSDSIPAMLSDGEFVQREAAVAYYGAAFMDALNRKRIPREESADVRRTAARSDSLPAARRRRKRGLRRGDPLRPQPAGTRREREVDAGTDRDKQAARAGEQAARTSRRPASPKRSSRMSAVAGRAVPLEVDRHRRLARGDADRRNRPERVPKADRATPEARSVRDDDRPDRASGARSRAASSRSRSSTAGRLSPTS